MSRTVRRKNGKDFYNCCVKRQVRFGGHHLRSYDLDPIWKPWEYHSDGRHQDRPWTGYLKQVTNRLRRAERSRCEHAYMKAVDHLDVDYVVPPDFYLDNDWSYD